MPILFAQSDPRARLAAAAVALFLAGALIGLGAGFGWVAPFDRWLLLEMAADPGTAYAATMSALTHVGDAPVRLAIAALAAAWLAWRGRWREAVLLAATVAAGMLLVGLVKAAVARPRPDLLPHLDLVSSPSFPSAHAANAMVLWLTLALLLRPGRIATPLLLTLPLEIGASRVALAVHWPSDVLAGWAIGGGWALLLVGLLGPRARRA